jgi:hypothetical protein
METVVRYQADDGSVWATEDAARKRDTQHAAAEAILRTLVPTPSEFNQRTAVSATEFNRVRTALVELCRREFPREQVFQRQPEDIHPMSYAGRFISGSGWPSLNEAWWWLSCWHDGYLYQQPFYALNPDKWKGGQ